MHDREYDPGNLNVGKEPAAQVLDSGANAVGPDTRAVLACDWIDSLASSVMRAADFVKAALE